MNLSFHIRVVFLFYAFDLMHQIRNKCELQNGSDYDGVFVFFIFGGEGREKGAGSVDMVCRGTQCFSLWRRLVVWCSFIMSGGNWK